MADPLSIFASVVTVIGAAAGVGKTLSLLRRLKNAPIELLALNNEVSDMRIVFDGLKRFLGQENSRLQSDEHYLQKLSTLVSRAESQLLELHKLIQHRLVQPTPVSTDLKVSHYQWIRAKPTIDRCRRGLRDIRLNITTLMMTLNT